MPKVKPERIAGIVALSYLVLIPAGAAFVWAKVQAMDEDIDHLWDNSGLPKRDSTLRTNRILLARLFGR